MAGVDAQPELVGEFGAFDEAFQFLCARIAGGVGEGAGVELDVFGFQIAGGLDLVRIRVDEEADNCADGVELADRFVQGGVVREAIEPAFRGYFVAIFRNEAGIVGSDLECDGHDFRRVAHFEIELGLERFLQPEDIAILDVAAIFAQVCGDAVGSGFLRNEGGGDRVGFDQDALRITRVPRLAQGGCVVDVDAEAERHGQTFPP